jgi:hypothetical protein
VSIVVCRAVAFFLLLSCVNDIVHWPSHLQTAGECVVLSILAGMLWTAANTLERKKV